MKQTKKIEVIYIVGMGHSGSTLLNILLGSAQNTISVGELKNFEEYSLGENISNPKIKRIMKCDCGRNLNDCDFWAPIVEKVNIKSLAPLKSSFMFKIKILLNVLFLKNLKNNISSKKGDYKLYKHIMNVAKNIKSNRVEYIIDSSKNLRNLYLIAQNANIHVKPIFLIRDGRAVVNSYEKMNENWIKTYFVWFFSNVLMSIYIKRNFSNKDYLKLSYDLFAQNPQRCIKLLNKKFNLNVDEENYIQNINREIYHSIAGNQIIRDMKNNDFKRKQITSIKYDQSWKKRMPKWKQRVLTVLCYIPNRLWVYNKKLD